LPIANGSARRLSIRAGLQTNIVERLEAVEIRTVPPDRCSSPAISAVTSQPERLPLAMPEARTT
jgi:hypothetical protein